jgi:HEAT repeat protein
MRLHGVLAFLLATALGSTTLVRASEDFCSSPSFRDAFLAGRKSIDFPSVSPTLIGFGDRAIPCLTTIAAHGADALGITECDSERLACRTWAIGTIGKIGTPKARGYLREFVRVSKDPDLLVVASRALVSLQDEQARPVMIELLKNPNMRVRSNAILALGVIHNPADFDMMLAATLSLPPEEIYTGAQGLLKLGDTRAIEPLEKHAKTMSDPTFRNSLDRVIENLKRKRDARP